MAGVKVKMDPLTEGDNNYSLCTDHLPDNKGCSQAFFDLYYNPVNWREEYVNSFPQMRKSLDEWSRNF